MKAQRNLLGAALLGALAAGPAVAEVTGVPGEALLVPLVMNNANRGTDNGVAFTNTYVQVRIPTTLGNDFVMNRYTAPNVTQSGTVTTPANNDPDYRIHWTFYDYKSKQPLNNTCEVSPGDVVMWTTDTDLLDATVDPTDPDSAELGDVVVCGQALPRRIGYLVIQTYSGADGAAADFAMEGTAYLTDFDFDGNELNDNGDNLLSIPVIPMADGADPFVPGQAPVIDCDASLQVAANEVINQGAVDGTATNPCKAAPLAAGVRLNNGDGFQNTVHLSAGVQMGYSDPVDTGTPGYSLHVFWFPTVDEDRLASGFMWDTDENPCSQDTPLPWEVNMWLYNAETKLDNDGKFESFDDSVIEGFGSRADVIAALAMGEGTDPEGYGFVCQPKLWAETVMGYAQYIIPELPDDEGQVTQAGVFFEAQDDDFNGDAWTSHAMYARGFQF